LTGIRLTVGRLNEKIVSYNKIRQFERRIEDIKGRVEGWLPVDILLRIVEEEVLRNFLVEGNRYSLVEVYRVQEKHISMLPVESLGEVLTGTLEVGSLGEEAVASFLVHVGSRDVGHHLDTGSRT
jgi:hypothetical protein